MQELEEIVQAPEVDSCYIVVLSLLQLSQYSQDTVQHLLEQPTACLQDVSAALLTAQQLLISSFQKEEAAACSVKSRVQLRLLPLPVTSSASLDLLNPSVSQLLVRHSQRLVTIHGTVVRCGSVNVLESHRLYECKQCLHR